MFGNLFKSRSNSKSYVFNPKVTLLLPVEVSRDGVLVRTSAFKTVDASSSENQFKSSDFSIGNLLSIGAFNTLKQTCVVNTSRLCAADSFDNFNLPSDVSQS